MKKTHGRLCIILGAALLFAALSLVLYNLNQDRRSGNTARELLAELRQEMPVTSEVSELPSETGFGGDLFVEYETTEPAEEKLIEADGRLYVGIISIPSLQLELPVLSEWSYPNLKLSPCRYSGTAAGGNLIIAAHNYRSHFGRLQELVSGDTIFFTDGYGVTYEYETVQTENINGKDISAMESGSADGWDLTLFTCTLSGQSRVAVRAVLVL